MPWLFLLGAGARAKVLSDKGSTLSPNQMGRSVLDSVLIPSCNKLISMIITVAYSRSSSHVIILIFPRDLLLSSSSRGEHGSSVSQ